MAEVDAVEYLLEPIHAEFPSVTVAVYPTVQGLLCAATLEHASAVAHALDSGDLRLAGERFLEYLEPRQ